MGDYVEWVHHTVYDDSGEELVVGLAGGDAQLHVGGIPHIHNSSGDYDVIVELAHLPPVSELSYHHQRQSNAGNVDQVLAGSLDILGELLTCYQYEGESLD